MYLPYTRIFKEYRQYELTVVVVIEVRFINNIHCNTLPLRCNYRGVLFLKRACICDIHKEFIPLSVGDRHAKTEPIVAQHTYIFNRPNVQLTHLSLASFLWDIGKQYSHRCDAAERGVPSVAIMFAKRIFIKSLYEN